MRGWTEARTVTLDASGVACSCPVFRESCQLCHHMFASFRWLLHNHSFFNAAFNGLCSRQRESTLAASRSHSSGSVVPSKAAATELGKKVSKLMDVLKCSRWWLTRNTPVVDAAASETCYASVFARYQSWRAGLLDELEVLHQKQSRLEVEAAEAEARKLKRTRLSVRPNRYRDDADGDEHLV